MESVPAAVLAAAGWTLHPRSRAGVPVRNAEGRSEGGCRRAASLIVDVLSPGDRDGTRDDVRAYATLPGVREIVVVHSTRTLAEVHRRGPDGAWAADPEWVGPGERVFLAGVGLDRAIEDADTGTPLARRSSPPAR